MKKKEFLKELEKNLKGLPERDIEERIEFYSEMIDDRIEDGKTEEEAVSEIGSIDEVVDQIAKDTSLVRLVKNKITPKKSISGSTILFLILGFPLWFPLTMVFFALVLVFFVVLWALVIVTYAVEAVLFGGAGIYAVAAFAQMADGVSSKGAVGLSIACLGAALIFIFVCIAATKVTFKLNKSVLTGIKRSFIGGNKNA